MTVTLAAIRPILRVADICDLLRISERQFYELKTRGFFEQHRLLVEVQPRIDRHPRYAGEPFVRLLSDRNQMRLLRSELLELSA